MHAHVGIVVAGTMPPGVGIRRSIAHLLVKQRDPFKTTSRLHGDKVYILDQYIVPILPPTPD